MSKTDQPTNWEMVVYALSLVGGEFDRVHTEDLAVKCHELFPGAFSWTKYPQFPDKDIVRVALTDARKEKNGTLVEGRTGERKGHPAKTSRAPVTDGWILTPAGRAFLAEQQDRLNAVARGGQQKDHRQMAQKRIKRVTRHPLFRTFLDDPAGFEPQIGELAALLRCRVDADPQVWNKRFDGLMQIAVVIDDEPVQAFLARCEEAYQQQR